MKMTFKHLASTLAVAGLLLTGSAGAQQSEPGDLQPQADTQQEETKGYTGAAGDTAASTRMPAGIAFKENARTAAVEEAIRNVLRTATAAALDGDVNKLIEQLSHPDRERLQGQTPVDLNPIRQTTGALTKTFKETYGLATSLTDEDMSALNMTVTVGEIADPSALTNWPLDPIVGTKGMTGTSEPSVQRGPVETVWRGAARTASGVINRDYMAEGRDVAVVVLPPASGLPELNVSMTHEAIDFWKIDIPDNMDLATLQRNLSDQIGKFANETKSWPPDQNETERLFARRVLMALYDVEVTDTHGVTTSPGSETTYPDMEK